MKNPLVDFLAEFVVRLFADTPKFFKIVQWISIVVGGISAGITYWQSLGKVLPEWLVTVGNVNVIIGSVVAIVISQLTKKDVNQDL
jgi:hypothetical protein